MMDNDVYTSDQVGNYFKDKFICVKIQMDSTKKDDTRVQKWYTDASTLKQEYKIAAFPTYLFFSPDGKIVHKDIGAKPPEALIATAQSALDPSKQYHKLLENYQEGNLSPSEYETTGINKKYGRG